MAIPIVAVGDTVEMVRIVRGEQVWDEEFEVMRISGNRISERHAATVVVVDDSGIDVEVPGIGRKGGPQLFGDVCHISEAGDRCGWFWRLPRQAEV